MNCYLMYVLLPACSQKNSTEGKVSSYKGGLGGSGRLSDRLEGPQSQGLEFQPDVAGSKVSVFPFLRHASRSWLGWPGGLPQAVSWPSPGGTRRGREAHCHGNPPWRGGRRARLPPAHQGCGRAVPAARLRSWSQRDLPERVRLHLSSS